MRRYVYFRSFTASVPSISRQSDFYSHPYEFYLIKFNNSEKYFPVLNLFSSVLRRGEKNNQSNACSHTFACFVCERKVNEKRRKEERKKEHVRSSRMRLMNMCDGVICLLPMIYVQIHDEIDITKQRAHTHTLTHMYLIIIVFI